MTKIEMIERKLYPEANKPMIVDRHYIAEESAARSAQQAKSAINAAWISTVAAIVSTIAAVIALFI